MPEPESPETDVSPEPESYETDALYELHQRRQVARRWGLLALVLGLIVGAVIAPHTTLLVFVALLVFGIFGTAVGWGLRQIDRLLSPPRN